MNCECEFPANIHNGVCGSCLYPLATSVGRVPDSLNTLDAASAMPEGFERAAFNIKRKAYEAEINRLRAALEGVARGHTIQEYDGTDDRGGVMTREIVLVTPETETARMALEGESILGYPDALSQRITKLMKALDERDAEIAKLKEVINGSKGS